MENIITLNINEFKSYLNTLIESSYELGILYEKCRPSFSKEEAIKRIQNKNWEKLKNLLNMEE